MLIETLSVFPELFEPYMSTSIMGRARRRGLFDFMAHDLRDWTMIAIARSMTPRLAAAPACS